MAKTTADVAAAKAKKQKIILIVGGVLLLGVAAIQGPKLMKKDSQPAATPAATSESVGAADGTTDRSSRGHGLVARVRPSRQGSSPALRSRARPSFAWPRASSRRSRSSRSRIRSSSRPASSPPAVRQPRHLHDANGQATSASTQSRGDRRHRRGGDLGIERARQPPPVVYATINLDGKPQQLKVKQKFPESDPLFVLRSLTKKQAKIGVAGGSFDDGQAVTLQFGKKLTLVNTATGVRYVLKLVYTGTAPETIEGFTTGQGEPAAAGATAGTSTAATTAAPS